MVQKESQAALEERESERNANPASVSGASLEPSAAPAPGEDNPSGAGAAAGTGAAGGARRFLCGVVEGFYGRPWVMEQRKELFRRLQKWELNTYLYAPKDDYKHRMFWREMYSVEEAEQLMTLISAAREYEIEFIYAISPGLDITFSNPKEVSTLKRKLDQVSQFGCRSFALLLMILIITCVQQTKKCSVLLHMHKFPSQMKSISTWESRKPSSSVPQNTAALSVIQVYLSLLT